VDSLFGLKSLPISPQDEGYMPFLKHVLEMDDEEEIKEFMKDFPSDIRDYDLPSEIEDDDDKGFESGNNPKYAKGEKMHEYTKNEVLANKLLWVSAMNGDLVQVKRAIEDLGAIVDSSNRKWKHFRALHYAATFNRSAVALLLIEDYGAVVDVQDTEGFTPLLRAVKFGNLEVCKILVKFGAMPIVWTRNHWNGFDLAMMTENEEIMKFLQLAMVYHFKNSTDGYESYSGDMAMYPRGDITNLTNKEIITLAAKQRESKRAEIRQYLASLLPPGKLPRHYRKRQFPLVNASKVTVREIEKLTRKLRM